MSFTAAHLYFDDVEVGQEWESLGRRHDRLGCQVEDGIDGITIKGTFQRPKVLKLPLNDGSATVYSRTIELGLRIGVADSYARRSAVDIRGSKPSAYRSMRST